MAQEEGTPSMAQEEGTPSMAQEEGTPSMAQEGTPPATERASPSPPRRAEAAGAGDRLSALDDATLHAILAHLPLRDAAATAALSRRWPRVFATLPRLLVRPATFNRRGFPDDGDDDLCEDAERWRSALRRVVSARFRARARAAPVAAFDVEAVFTGLHGEWARDVFRDLCGSGGLLELVFSSTNYAECFPLPSPVYTCKTLTSLDLHNCRLRLPIKITGLRAVRSLRLRNVVATDADIRRIITRCAAVERLDIHQLHMARSVLIRGPRLEKLEIYSYRPLCISVSKALRLETLRLSFFYSHPEYYWSVHDIIGTDEGQSFPGMENTPDYRKMAEREHEQTDEIRNMIKLLGGLGSVKQIRLYLSNEYSEVLNVDKVPLLKRFPQKSSLPALTTLALTLDHNHEVLASLISCLLNSSPNLRDLTVIELPRSGSPAPLTAAFWAEQVTDDGVLDHLSTATFYTDPLSLFEDHHHHPYGGLCQFLVMRSRALERMRIVYHRLMVKPEHEAKLEAVRTDLLLWPRASADLLLELCPVDRFPWF